MGICISRHAVYHGRLDAMADESSARLGDPTAASSAPTPATHNSLTESETEALADELLASRSFRNGDEVRRFAATMAGKPGSTPMPRSALPPSLERATQRRIRALAQPTIKD